MGRTDGAGGGSQPFLNDIEARHARARKYVATGNVTSIYRGDVAQAIAILQNVLASEVDCVLRYSTHAIAAAGLSSQSLEAEFSQNATEEWGHMMEVAGRINQLGGAPNFNPDGMATRSAPQSGEASNLGEMIRENLMAEQIAVDHYKGLIRYFTDDDPATRIMLEGILIVEEAHANDMRDLLVDYEGKPSLSSR